MFYFKILNTQYALHIITRKIELIPLRIKNWFVMDQEIPNYLKVDHSRPLDLQIVAPEA